MNLSKVIKFAGFCLAFATIHTFGQFVGMGLKHAFTDTYTTSPEKSAYYYAEPQAECTPQKCPPRKVLHPASPSLPKQEVGKLIRVANTISARNQRAAQAGDTP